MHESPRTVHAREAEELISRAADEIEQSRRVIKRAKGRPREAALVDPATDPRPYVGLRVAAEYLGVHVRTAAGFIDRGDILAAHHGSMYRIAVRDLGRFKRECLTPSLEKIS